MKRIFYACIALSMLVLVTLSVYAEKGTVIFPIVLKWGEIIIVFSLLAGIFRLIKTEITKIYERKQSVFHPIVVIFAFFITFAAGMLNFESNKAVMNNSVKEHPEYMSETVAAMIDGDTYLRKYPAKNKLILYVSGKVSYQFIPTEEMLKSADISIDEFSNLRSDKTKLLMNEDDVFRVELLIEKVRKAALETVKTMLPASREMKEWFEHSVILLPDRPLDAEDVKLSAVNDLVLGDSDVEKSGTMLKDAIAGYLEKNDIHEIEKGDILVNYRDFVVFSGIGKSVVSQYSGSLDESISKDTAEKILFAFLKTGTVSSPKIKGVLQWIYRRIYDPLYSSFMALFLLSMIAAAYRRFTLRSYSLGVVTVSAIVTILGFLPFLFSGKTVLFRDDFMMNVVSVPVFIALIIATGTGVIFFYADRLFRIFYKGNSK